MQSESKTIGPELPPGFAASSFESDEADNSVRPVLPLNTSQSKASQEDDGRVLIGPVLPTRIRQTSFSQEDRESVVNVIGPVLPVNSTFSRKSEQDEDSRQNVIGPCLPPGMSHNAQDPDERTDCFGPSLPPQMKPKEVYGPVLPTTAFQSSSTVIGPVFPGASISNSDSSDGEDIGPKLYEAADAETQNRYTAASDFERRAEKMKDKLLSKDSHVTRREEWMTELPSRLGTQIGLGPRSFKKQSYVGKDNDDRSEWTDTPADRKRKAEMGEKPDQGPSVSEMALHKRNKEISEDLQKYNKSKRKESLLEMHKRKRKEKKGEKCKMERREFDRDKDLNIQNLDAAQAKSFIDKARLFNGKFSHGSSHFL